MGAHATAQTWRSEGQLGCICSLRVSHTPWDADSSFQALPNIPSLLNMGCRGWNSLNSDPHTSVASTLLAMLYLQPDGSAFNVALHALGVLAWQTLTLSLPLHRATEQKRTFFPRVPFTPTSMPS